MKVHIFSDKNVRLFAIFNIYFIFVIVLIFSDENVRRLASEQTILAAKTHRVSRKTQLVNHKTHHVG